MSFNSLAITNSSIIAEERTLASVKSPCIAIIYVYVKPRSTTFIVMCYATLRNIQRRTYVVHPHKKEEEEAKKGYVEARYRQ